MFTKWNTYKILFFQYLVITLNERKGERVAVVTDRHPKEEKKKGGVIMFETNKLRGRMVEIFGSQTAFCETVGCSKSFVSLYLQGKTSLSQDTIAKWSKALDIPSDELDAYFFTPKVHETEQ